MKNFVKSVFFFFYFQPYLFVKRNILFLTLCREDKVAYVSQTEGVKFYGKPYV